jgi:ferredoxin
VNSVRVSAASAEQQGIAHLSPDACLTACRPGLPCTSCADACPERAIRVTERKVDIDPAACSGCGRCATVCPTGAIALPAIPASDLYECSRVRRADNGAESVPCLGGLTAATLRDALAGGDVTLIDRGWCATCPVSDAQAAPWEGAVRSVNSEAEILGLGVRVQVRHDPLASWRAGAAPRKRSENPSRRALFSRMAQAGQSVGPTDPMAGLPAPVTTPGPRHRATQLTALAQGAALSAALFPALSVAGQPRDLSALARLCPTGALCVTESEISMALVFDAVACIACGDCTQSGALALETAPQGRLGSPTSLITRPRAICTRCKARFSPRAQETSCDCCARDTELVALAHGLRRHAT